MLPEPSVAHETCTPHLLPSAYSEIHMTHLNIDVHKPTKSKIYSYIKVTTESINLDLLGTGLRLRMGLTSWWRRGGIYVQLFIIIILSINAHCILLIL